LASLFVGHAAQKSKLHNLQYDEGGNHMAETETETETETPTLIDRPFAKHRNSLSFGTHRWCFLTSTIT
jgi:hypothetical protein